MDCKANGCISSTRDSVKHLLLLRHQIPEQYQEDFIQGQYRPPNSSFKYCMKSAFQWHNETMNFWTHFLALLLLEAYCLSIFPCNLWPPTSFPPKYYPLVCYSSTLFCCLLFSSIAHLFMCMAGRTRHLCFFLDYCAICVVGTGAACSAFWFERPAEGWLLFQYVSSQWVFLPLISVCSILSCCIACASRHYWNQNHRKLIRSAAISSVFLLMSIPCGDKVAQCILIGPRLLRECAVFKPHLYIVCYRHADVRFQYSRTLGSWQIRPHWSWPPMDAFLD